jgi:hydrogenase maturation protein HypF
MIQAASARRGPEQGCYRIRVWGQVQGVGFRPFVYRLAADLGLGGWVRNDASGVEMEIAGQVAQLDDFRERLVRDLPPLARIDRVECNAGPVPQAAVEPGFRIVPSTGGQVATGVTPDSVVCPECLSELFDPGNRRYRYAFINCTHCGPRYTLTHSLPYDRPNTSMAVFEQCSSCLDEYRNPLHRRFHAQPNACPECGPALQLLNPAGDVLAQGENQDPVKETVRMLRAGEIVAVKGLGGFHLLCDARNADAVARLRARKHREAKPLAVMAVHPHALADLVEIDRVESDLLHARERPIVLLRKRPECDAILPDVAPGLAWLGAMLAYTPLHYLLFHEMAGRPAGTDWIAESSGVDGLDGLLVCTSANPGGEPLVIDNLEALRRLAGIADAVLVHDRDILVRCDDSVIRVGVEGAAFLRRARGYTPSAIRLARSGPSTLALGGWLKNTACVTRGSEAFLSQHIGDLDNAATCRSLEETVEHLLDVLQIRPERVACDLHPDFFSSQLAARWAEVLGVPLVRVQHHHAHLASVQAEHGLCGPVIGVAMDGVGLGLDGTAWGGELLRLEGADFVRLGHLHPLALPGGDRAAREPWRMAAAALHALGRSAEIEERFPEQPLAAGLRELLERGVNCPMTTSLGRHFDAAAGLLGVQPVQRFEGQAAMRLEGLAARYGPVAALARGWVVTPGADIGLDLRPVLRWLADRASDAKAQNVGHSARTKRDWAKSDWMKDDWKSSPTGSASLDLHWAEAAAVFHATLAAALVEWVGSASQATGVRDLVFSGGCVLNQVLMREVKAGLERQGFRVFLPRLVPANDGGLSLGQAWVAMFNGHNWG